MTRAPQWPPERLRLLAELWAAGTPTPEIARLLRTTKGSIHGAIHRNKIPSRPPPSVGRPQGSAGGKLWADIPRSHQKCPRPAAPAAAPLEALPPPGYLPSPAPPNAPSTPPAALAASCQPRPTPDAPLYSTSPAALAIAALAPNQCRWPHGDVYGDPTFHFCQSRRLDGWPYCSSHLAEAGRPAAAGRRTRQRAWY